MMLDSRIVIHAEMKSRYRQSC